MDKQGQKSIKPNETVSHREWRQVCKLGRESQRHVGLFRGTCVSFERPHKYSLLVHTCQRTSPAPYCTDTVTDMLFWSEPPHVKPDIPAPYQDGHTEGNKSLLCVFHDHKKGFGRQKLLGQKRKCPSVEQNVQL